MTEFNFTDILRKCNQLKQELPILLANQAQVYFTESFAKQGWDGKAWKEVERRISGTPEYKYPKYKGLSRRSTPILVRTGNLRRAVSNSVRTGHVSFDEIKLVVPIAYASFLNQGTNKIEQREFIGDSPILRKNQIQLIENEIKKVFENI
ncbi:MAG: hypothetical protein M3Z26_00505 [Bacteroidota bacterium]|nr:hypothetical protein [Bacteroidota bacterium]